MLLLSTCFTQAAQVSSIQRRTLQRVLSAAIERHVGVDARLAVVWITVPAGSGYSAGRPSRSSIVQVSVPDEFDQIARVSLMREISERWCEVTGQAPAELMVGAPDRSAARALLAGLLAEIPLLQKPRVLGHYASQLVRGLLVARA